jgi:small subunit ribosomal protein S2
MNQHSLKSSRSGGCAKPKGDNMAEVNLKELLEAGAHFGHQTRRWNPKMKPYIFGVRGGVHIIDLTKTAPRLKAAIEFAKQVTAQGGTVLFVGTKRQAAPVVTEEAKAAGMPYVTERWLGGMLTNFRTIRSRVNRLKKLEAGLETGDFATKYNKKEVLDFSNEAEALNKVFGGIKHMDGLPGAIFVVDAPTEGIAIAEARKLGIPVIAIADTNSDPDVMDYPIPGNDDAIRAVKAFTNAIATAAAEGAKLYASKAKESSDK